jgi:hydrogenase maturation protease
LNRSEKIMMSARKSNILVIGVGNAYRSDDAVGLIVARGLKKGTLDHIKVLEESGEGATLMESWKDAGTVILIDAVHSGATPGTIHRLDSNAQAISTTFFHYSTHAFGVAEAIELARTLDQLPPRLIVYGVEGESFEAGVELSSEVEKAAQEVVKLVIQETYSYNSGA